MAFFRIVSNNKNQKINYLIINKFGIKKFDNMPLQSIHKPKACNADLSYFKEILFYNNLLNSK